MYFGKRKGYLAYPVLALAILFASASMRAQDASSQQQTESPAQIQDQSQSQTQTPEQRVEVLRRAQQRVRARRERRVQQIIRDTYSHQYELYFGGGYLRFRPGHSLQKKRRSLPDRLL